jgi:tetratricopeptide (TPR) repeat protein
MSLRLMTAVGAAAALASAPPHVRDSGDAWEARWRPISLAQASLMARADSLYFAGVPAAALEICDSVLARDSLNSEMLWRGARASLVLGFQTPIQRPDDRHYRKAEVWARTLVRIAPSRADGHFWLAAALGRQSLAAQQIAKAPLAEAAYTAALKVLAIDSLHAGAHNILGRIHAEVRDLPRYHRWVAATILGVRAAKHSSWDSAMVHLRRAAVLDSTVILFRLDLGEALLRAGRRSEAVATLRSATLLRPIHPPDRQLQHRARELIGRAG